MKEEEGVLRKRSFNRLGGHSRSFQSRIGSALVSVPQASPKTKKRARRTLPVLECLRGLREADSIYRNEYNKIITKA